MQLGKEASALCTKELFSQFGFYELGIFIAPIRLEFEKVLFPYLLMSKKRYTGGYYTRLVLNLNCTSDCNIKKAMTLDQGRIACSNQVGNTRTLTCPCCKKSKTMPCDQDLEAFLRHDKLMATGIELVRRDKCGIVRETMETCLKLILIKRDPEKAYQYAKIILSDMKEGNIDMSKLLLAQKYSKATKDYKVQAAHIKLVEKMIKRDPATAPRMGDRVPYAIMAGCQSHKKTGKNKDKTFMLGEDPLYMIANNIPVDVDYYIENKLKNPLVSIFAPIFSKEKVAALFVGDHMRKIKKSTPKIGISQYLVALNTCLKCNGPVRGDSAFCEHHDTDDVCAEMYNLTIDKFSYYEKLNVRLETNCQKCQSVLTQEISCVDRGNIYGHFTNYL